MALYHGTSYVTPKTVVRIILLHFAPRFNPHWTEGIVCIVQEVNIFKERFDDSLWSNLPQNANDVPRPPPPPPSAAEHLVPRLELGWALSDLFWDHAGLRRRPEANERVELRWRKHRLGGAEVGSVRHQRDAPRGHCWEAVQRVEADQAMPSDGRRARRLRGDLVAVLGPTTREAGPWWCSGWCAGRVVQQAVRWTLGGVLPDRPLRSHVRAVPVGLQRSRPLSRQRVSLWGRHVRVSGGLPRHAVRCLQGRRLLSNGGEPLCPLQPRLQEVFWAGAGEVWRVRTRLPGGGRAVCGH